MDVSIFSVLGPVMIGPSSSHTAGAVKLARVARLIAAKPFEHVSFGLHGSFSETYRGHGTDKALVAGALGLHEDDERLVDAFSLAEQAGLTFAFYPLELNDVHENSVKITFFHTDGTKQEVVGSSIGGGQIIISRVGNFEVEFSAENPTLVVCQHDRKGTVTEVSRVLAENNINIAIMRLSRRARGDIAFCIIETDSIISEEIVAEIEALQNVISVQAVNIGGGEE